MALPFPRPAPALRDSAHDGEGNRGPRRPREPDGVYEERIRSTLLRHDPRDHPREGDERREDDGEDDAFIHVPPVDRTSARQGRPRLHDREPEKPDRERSAQQSDEVVHVFLPRQRRFR